MALLVGAVEMVMVEAGELARLRLIEAAARAAAEAARWALADEPGKRVFEARMVLLLEVAGQGTDAQD